MKSIPVLDASLLHQGDSMRQRFIQDLLTACAEHGCFYLDHSDISPRLCKSVLEQADVFFNLPDIKKMPFISTILLIFGVIRG